MEYRIVTELPHGDLLEAWRACLTDSDHASHYTAPEYFLEPYLRSQQPFAVLACQDGRIDGIATGIIVGKTLQGGLACRPQICLRREANESVGATLAKGLLTHARGRSAFLTVTAWEPVAGFEATGFKSKEFTGENGVVLLDLRRGAPTLFKEFSETRRNKIRRAIKQGVEVSQMTDLEAFDDYYALYRHWCEFKKVNALPYDVQRTAFALSGNRLILVARHAGRIIGVSTFRYERGGVIEYAANVSRRDETKVRQNDLLLWRAIEWAAEQGFRTFSMAGAHFFLQKFGGYMHTTHGYQVDRSLFRQHDLKEALSTAAVSVYRKLPQSVRRGVKQLVRGSDGDGTERN